MCVCACVCVHVIYTEARVKVLWMTVARVSSPSGLSVVPLASHVVS